MSRLKAKHRQQQQFSLGLFPNSAHIKHTLAVQEKSHLALPTYCIWQHLSCCHVFTDLQHLVCTVWLTPLSPLITTCHLWIPATLTACKQTVNKHTHAKISVSQTENSSGPLQGLSLCFFILAPNMKQAVWEFWLIHTEYCVVYSPKQRADKCLSLTLFCFGGWAIPPCGLVFSLWCASTLCHSLSLGLKVT